MSLVKLTATTYTPGDPGSPGSPGRPAIPSYCETHTESSCAWVPNPEIHNEVRTGTRTVYPDGFTPVTETYTYTVPVPTGVPITIFQCGPKLVTVCHPAQAAIPSVPSVPATPAQMAVTRNYGWTNGRADSLLSFDLGKALRFKVSPASMGVFVGIDGPYSNTQAPSAFPHGLMIDSAGARVYEFGIFVNTLAATWYGTTEFLITRTRSGGVKYQISGGSSYSSTVPIAGTMYAYSALYASGDTITDSGYEDAAAETILDTGAMSLSALVMLGAEDADYGEGRCVLPALTLSGSDDGSYSFGAMSLPALVMLASESADYGEGRCTIPALTISARGDEYTPALPEGGYITLEALSMFGYDFTPTYDTGAMTLQPLVMLGSESANYGEGRCTLQPLTLRASEDLTPGVMWVVSPMLISSYDAMVSASTMTLSSALQLSDSWTLNRAATMTLTSGLGIGSTFSYVGAYQASYVSYLTIGDVFYMGTMPDVPLPDDPDVPPPFYPRDTKTIVVNVATGAATIHTGAGVSVGMGTSNFGTNKTKHIPAFYANAQGEAVTLTVKADDQTYTYTARNATTELDIQRIDIGRGLLASNWTMTLGGKFDQLESVEAIPVPGNRRI